MAQARVRKAVLTDPLSEAAFERASRSGNLIARWSRTPADHLTAITLADRFVREKHWFLLESATAGPEHAARHSLVGVGRVWHWRVRERRVFDSTSASDEPLEGSPLDALRLAFGKWKLSICGSPNGRLASVKDICEAAGATGFLGFDAIQMMEPAVGQPPPKRLGLDDAYYVIPEFLLVLDHLTRELTVVQLVVVSKGSVKAQFRKSQKAWRAMELRIQKNHRPGSLLLDAEPVDFAKAESAYTEKEFLALGERCLDAIRAGEVFQIQIGNRLAYRTKAHPFDVFRHLRMLNPSPYMFFFRCDDDHVLGASPEIMVRLEGRRVVHRPIAGTRRRTWILDRDAMMKKELQTSEKERAEHVMLVDLARNDVGRMAEVGSVGLEEMMRVEQYSHVFHLVSQVSGVLREGLDGFDALEYSFPNGTVTGAPKIRSVQLIYEMEKMAREFYAGCLGVFAFSGDIQTTILIRTIHMAHGLACTQASAGFVYDSVPRHEWQETRNKMAACLTAMQRTLPRKASN